MWIYWFQMQWSGTKCDALEIGIGEQMQMLFNNDNVALKPTQKNRKQNQMADQKRGRKYSFDWIS